MLFVHKDSRTHKTLINSIVSMGFYLLEFFLRFYSRKIFLNYLGTELLGLNTTAVNILQFINLIELGLGSVMGFALFKPIYEKDENSVIEIMLLQKIMYRRIAIGIIIISVIVMFFFPIIFHKIQIPLWYAYATFSVILFSSLLGYFYNYKSIVLTSAQLNYKLHLANRPIGILKSLLQIIAIVYSPYPYISWLALEFIFAIIITISIQKITHKNFPYLKHKIEKEYEFLKNKYRFVLIKMRQTFFHKFAAVVLQQSSSLIIYAYTTLSMVALYGNYTVIINGLSQLIYAIFNSMGAGIGNLIAEGDHNKIMSVFFELFNVRFAIAMICSFGVFVLSQPFIVNWLGKIYLLPMSTLSLVTILFFINISRNTVDLFLGAQGITRDIWAAVTETVLNLGCSITLGKFFGLNGIIGGVIISLVLIVLIWKPIFLFKEGFHESVFMYFKTYLLQIIIALISGCLALFILSKIGLDPNKGWKQFIMYGVLIECVFVVFYIGILYCTFPSIRRFMFRLKTLFNIK